MTTGERATGATVPVGNDRTIEIRPVRPDDDVALMALYEGLDPEDRQRRFFSVFHPKLAFFTTMATESDRGGARLVAVLHEAGRDERIVGEAGYTMLPNGDGELGMVVASGWRGWLGPYLLDALITVAAARGVPNIEADVLTSNRPMLALLRSRGMAVMEHEDWTVCRLLIGTHGERPAWPTGPDGPRVLVEGAGGRWHGEETARAAGLHVITCPGPHDGRRGCPALEGRPCSLVTGADVVVISHPGDDDEWRQLLARHADVHPGVPIVIESATAPDALPPGACVVPGGADVVSFVRARAAP